MLLFVLTLLRLIYIYIIESLNPIPKRGVFHLLGSFYLYIYFLPFFAKTFTREPLLNTDTVMK